MTKLLPRLKHLSGVLLVVILASLTAPAVAQENISDAKDERDSARRGQLDVQSNLNILEAADEDIKLALGAANELVAAQQARVESAAFELSLAESEAYRTGVALEWASQSITDLQGAVQAFAVETYVSIPSDDDESWISSSDLNETARRNAILSSLGRSAGDTMDILRAAQEDLEALVVQSETAVAAALGFEIELEEELDYLDVAVQRQAELSAAMQTRIANWENELAGFEQDERDLSEFIRRRQLELAGIGGNAQPGVESARGWVWPTAGSRGSGFGPRLHPILGYVRNHNGLDIGGAQGQGIWSAKAGEVILAGWNGGYGNAVIVLHPGGITSLYAHMSKVNVRVGEKVETGELIGLVGSTGLSTGPHLHFEVTVNGILTDPRPFLP